jgi:hypothetical protein
MLNVEEVVVSIHNFEDMSQKLDDCDILDMSAAGRNGT